MSATKRSFLFLQGPSSPLFARLADQLQAKGHAVHKINFSAGDVVYWLPRKASQFRGKLEELPDFVESIWLKHGITDQIVFGDCRPVHSAAVKRAERFGIRTHVFECGYFRPFWITLEREGVNGHSLLPRDPDWFREVGKRLPNPVKQEKIVSSFTAQATHDVIYHLAGLTNPLLFPHYRNHSPYPAPVEYAGLVKRSLLIQLNKHQETESFNKLIREKVPFYLLPLQLNSDAQIRHHSRFENMTEVIEYVMHSFAKHAPANTSLVIKNHPLDIGLVNYQKIVQQLERELDLSGRTVYFESINIGALLKHASGTVTINSTTGGFSLELNCPTISLADPIYNLPGLTFQGGLDTFWTEIPKPDAQLFRCYRNTVMYTTQINGSLYCRNGTTLAAKNAALVLEAEKSPLELCHELL
ncbi:MAG: capsule biosynthesis protein [Methylococcaceae bacterium]